MRQLSVRPGQQKRHQPLPCSASLRFRPMPSITRRTPLLLMPLLMLLPLPLPLPLPPRQSTSPQPLTLCAPAARSSFAWSSRSNAN